MSRKDDERPNGNASFLAKRLLNRAMNIAEWMPGGVFARSQARAMEDVLIQHLKNRMTDIRYQPPFPISAGDPPERVPGLAERFAILSEQSLHQTPETAYEILFNRLIGQLLPDEARILTAVSDGSRIAISHLLAYRRFSARHLSVLVFMSRIGQECGVMLADATPCYLQHLKRIGLLESGPEDSTQNDKYESIENGSAPRQVAEQLRREKRFRPVFVRETVHLSSIGKAFLGTCMTDE